MITAASGKLDFNLSLNASTAAEIASDTSNKKPSVMIIEKDKTLLVIIFSQPFFGLGFKPQMVFMESWISANTAVAVNTSVTMPMIAAMFSFLLTVALLMIVCS